MRPHTFDTYKDKYDTISLERNAEGILKVTFHERDKPDQPVRYDVPYDFHKSHVEWSHLFYDIARDYDNEVVILTNAGDTYLEESRTFFRSNAERVGKEGPIHPDDWEHVQHNGRFLQMNLLSIECPIIAAINGTAAVHAELALQSDIVLCSDTTTFQDLPHFESGLYAPGDGVQIFWPNAIGRARSQYFLLTGQVLDSQRALELGVVNEVMAKDKLMPRAYELAASILKRPKLVRRYTRIMGTQAARRQMVDELGYGLALEGLTVAARHVA